MFESNASSGSILHHRSSIDHLVNLLALASHSRLYQMVKQYLFASPSAVFGCPLAMTDGAARMFELHAPEVGIHLGSRQATELYRLTHLSLSRV